jgi:DNA-binding response OmpR family regulator
MGPRVLLTDADTLLLSLYQTYLVRRRMEVRVAATALQCLELLRQWRPDVLVLDADLPWGSGLGVLALMREDPTVPVVPVLLLARNDALAQEDFPTDEHTLLVKPVPAAVLAESITLLAQAPADLQTLDGVPPGFLTVQGGKEAREA